MPDPLFVRIKKLAEDGVFTREEAATLGAGVGFMHSAVMNLPEDARAKILHEFETLQLINNPDEAPVDYVAEAGRILKEDCRGH